MSLSNAQHDSRILFVSYSASELSLNTRYLAFHLKLAVHYLVKTTVYPNFLQGDQMFCLNLDEYPHILCPDHVAQHLVSGAMVSKASSSHSSK